ncbi:MAG TPA: sigma 54-interacting transcriptional regulator [Kofleriaceae bacterium]|nr:sigma 54-interacting transcriptional regulator [Kofleriaceae bacterium]
MIDTLTLLPERARDAQVSLAALFVVLDAGRPRAGTRHLMRGIERAVLGRGAKQHSTRDRSTLRIDLPDPHLSVEHAVIERALGGWTLRDLGSKNGVIVNGERTTQRALADGDWIEVGETFLRFRTLRISASSPDDVAAGNVPSLVPGVEQALRRLGDVAQSMVPVLLLGESGVGKEVAARMVHASSARPGGFVAVNCAGLVESLAAATLFGHSRGAYTGAIDDRPGAIRASDRGTLLLDEVGDLPLATQGTLLRVLQEREVVPVGETRPVAIDVRFVAATLRDLEREVEAGRFRVDLYARLAGLRVTLPPLRDRLEDLGGLVATSLARHGRPSLGLSSAAAWALCRYRWPLNIRELDQAIAAAVAVAQSDRIDLQQLPEQVAGRAPAAAVEAARRDELLGLLRDHRGNLAAVARALSTSRAQVHRLLRRYSIDLEAFRSAQ